MTTLKGRIDALKVGGSCFLPGYGTRAELGTTLASLSPKVFTTAKETQKDKAGLKITRTH